MYALSFDMVVSDLQKYYGTPYNKAYYDIKELLASNGFEWVQGSTYLSKTEESCNEEKPGQKESVDALFLSRLFDRMFS